jgi:hypothetical protein
MVTIEAYDTLGGDPIMGDQMREGKGENVDISSMDAKIDLASKVINAVPGKMIDQRTKINLRSMAMAQLMGYFPRLLWNRTLCHLAGARGDQKGKAWHLKTVAQSSAADLASKLINPLLAPTYNRHFVINGTDLVQGGAQLASIDSTDVWSLSVIDALVEVLDSLEFKLQPIKLPDDPAANYSPIKGVLYLDPIAYSMLKRDNTSGHNIRAWQAAAMERANLMGLKRHPLFMGEVLMWNGIVIRVELDDQAHHLGEPLHGHRDRRDHQCRADGRLPRLARHPDGRAGLRGRAGQQLGQRHHGLVQGASVRLRLQARGHGRMDGFRDQAALLVP